MDRVLEVLSRVGFEDCASLRVPLRCNGRAGPLLRLKGHP